MQRKELEKMYESERDHWWFAGKRIFFKRILSGKLAKRDLRILDVGSGTGAVPVDFSRYGWVCATDLSPHAMKLAKSRGVRAAVAGSAVRLPLASESVDLVLAFDILEHLKDDRSGLAEIERVLRPGGSAAIHVPAWPSLWSAHDEALEHERRYTRKSLAKLLAQTNLNVDFFGWTNASIFLPALLIRGLRRVFPHNRGESHESELFSLPEPLNSFMRIVYEFEAAVARWIGLPFGLSLAAVVTKPLSRESD